MSVTDLIPGHRYLISMVPWGVATVKYIGPVPGLPKRSRVENIFTGRRAWVLTEHLRPLLVECGRAKAANDDSLKGYALNLILDAAERKP